jgi:hypothetical protein
MEPELKKGTKKYREWLYQKDLTALLIKIRKNYENRTLKWMEENGLTANKK